jgi:hypothetical protein
MRVAVVSDRVYLALFTSPRVGQQGNSRNLRNVHPVQAVCEFVRIKSSHAFAAARSCPTSVRRMRVSSRQHVISTSLRGWLWFSSLAASVAGTSAGELFSSLCNGCATPFFAARCCSSLPSPSAVPAHWVDSGNSADAAMAIRDFSEEQHGWYLWTLPRRIRNQ